MFKIILSYFTIVCVFLNTNTNVLYSFGILTALFGGVECIIEKHRAKHDVWNAVTGGCVVGATLSAQAGPAVRMFTKFIILNDYY